MKEYVECFVSYRTLRFSIGEMTDDELRYLKEEKLPLLNPDIIFCTLQDIPLDTVGERVKHYEALDAFLAVCENRELFYASNRDTDGLSAAVRDKFSNKNA